MDDDKKGWHLVSIIGLIRSKTSKMSPTMLFATTLCVAIVIAQLYIAFRMSQGPYEVLVP